MLRVTRNFMLGDRSITIFEMTLGEIRAWLKAITTSETGPDAVIDALLFEGFDPESLVRMTDLKHADLDGFSPSDLRQLVAACREINVDFFAMREQMAAAQRSLLSSISNNQR